MTSPHGCCTSVSDSAWEFSMDGASIGEGYHDGVNGATAGVVTLWSSVAPLVLMTTGCSQAKAECNVRQRELGDHRKRAGGKVFHFDKMDIACGRDKDLKLTAQDLLQQLNTVDAAATAFNAAHLMMLSNNEGGTLTVAKCANIYPDA